MKRILLVAAAILIAAVGIYWLQQRRTAARRFAEWEAERVEEVLPSVLLERVEWNRAVLTLGQFADFLMARTGLSIEIDDAVTGVKKSRELKVTIPHGEFSPEQVLSMALGPTGLVMDVRGPKILVTSIAK